MSNGTNDGSSGQGENINEDFLEDPPPPVADQTLALTQVAEEETPQQAPPKPARRKMHWSFTALMWFLGIAAFALVAFTVWRSNNPIPMDPAQAAAIAWGQGCESPEQLELNCGGDTVFYEGGHRWTVDGTAESRAEFGRLSSEQFASVRNIVLLNDCAPSPYCAMLFERYNRTRPGTQTEAPEPSAETAIPPPVATRVAPEPPVETSEPVQESPAFP